jgi:hypothetical protein
VRSSFDVRLPIEHINGAGIPPLLFPPWDIIFLDALKTIEEGCPTDFEEPGDIGSRTTLVHESPRLTNVFLVHRIEAVHFLPPALRGLDPFSGPFLDEFPLEFGQGYEDMTHVASGGCSGFNPLGNGSELDAPTGEVIEDGDQVTKESAKTIQLPDDEGIPGSELG